MSVGSEVHHSCRRQSKCLRKARRAHIRRRTEELSQMGRAMSLLKSSYIMARPQPAPSKVMASKEVHSTMSTTGLSNRALLEQALRCQDLRIWCLLQKHNSKPSLFPPRAVIKKRWYSDINFTLKLRSTRPMRTTRRMRSQTRFSGVATT